MIVELNVGLDVVGRRNSIKDCEERARLALTFLRAKFSSIKSAKYENEYEGPSGLTLEQGLYVKIKTDLSIFEVYGAVYELAVGVEQECIATYNPRSGVGKLIGPSAGKWGTFDLDYFEQFPEDYLV